MSRPSLVLIGIPGSGKSAVGGRLADAMHQPLTEVDELVEAELGAPAGEFFASSGEDDYRVVEERIALAVLRGTGIVALSSGAVDSAAVREALAGLRVVWLRATVSTITRRLSMHSLGMGTLIAIRNRMDAMVAERAPWYASVASSVVDTDRLTTEEVVRAIIGEQGDLP